MNEQTKLMPLTKAIDVNPKVKLERGRNYSFVEMADLNENVTRVRAKSEKAFSGSGAKFSHGDTLFARITPCLENGKIAKFLSVDSSNIGFGSTEFIVFRGREGVTTTDYAHYIATDPNFRAFAISKMTGSSGRQRVPVDALDHYHLEVPPISQQKAVAKILGDLDDKIDLLRAMNATLEEIARAVFRAWFIDFEPVHAKATGAVSFRGMPQELFDKLKTQLNKVPEGKFHPSNWAPCVLENLIDINPSRALNKGVFAPYVGMADVPLKGPAIETRVYREFTSGMRFQNGDTLLARITPCLENGKTALVDILAENEIGWGSTEFIVLSPTDKVGSEFIYCLARDEAFRDYAIKNMTGTSGRQRVPSDAIASFPMLKAPDEYYKAFGEFARPLFSKISANRDQISVLSQIRDTLLPKLVSGEIGVPDLEALTDGG